MTYLDGFRAHVYGSVTPATADAAILGVVAQISAHPQASRETRVPLRALFVMPLATPRGGAEASLLQLLEHCDVAGLTPTVAFLEPGPMLDWCRDHDVPSAVIDAGRLRQLGRSGRTILALARLVRETQADVVVGWMAKGHLYGGPAALIGRRASVWFQPGLPTGLALFDRLATLLPSQAIIVVSQGVAAAQQRLLPRRPTRLVYPAVDLARFDPEAIGGVRSTRLRLGLPPDGVIFGSVGRLDTWKGFGVMLAALPAVAERHPEATFVLVGGPHEFKPEYAIELREQARATGLDDRVRLVGQQDNPHEWMQAMDVFIHGSRHEPFGMVVIEAMALGKAVIASAEGGPTEVITDGVDGLLTPYGDARALAEAITTLLQDADLRRRMGAAAMRRAQDFSVRRYAVELGTAIAGTAAPGVSTGGRT